MRVNKLIKATNTNSNSVDAGVHCVDASLIDVSLEHEVLRMSC